MDREWLRERIERGDTVAAIAREAERDPSTVAYWLNRFGLVSSHAARVAPRGALAEADLRVLVEQGRSVREIARIVDRSPSTVRHWLRRHGLRTTPARRAAKGSAESAMLRECPRHGWVVYRRVGRGVLRCPQCVSAAVSDRRRKVKALLVAEAGGACRICGYDRHVAALHFHHVDPADKTFQISLAGATLSLAALRSEAQKCVLLCANCHAEVEAGMTAPPSDPGPSP